MIARCAGAALRKGAGGSTLPLVLYALLVSSPASRGRPRSRRPTAAPRCSPRGGASAAPRPRGRSWFVTLPATTVTQTPNDCATDGLSPELLGQVARPAFRRGLAAGSPRWATWRRWPTPSLRSEASAQPHRRRRSRLGGSQRTRAFLARRADKDAVDLHLAVEGEVHAMVVDPVA
jgi:hypothetical protein